LHSQTDQLIADAIQQKREAQQKLFELYSPKMLGVCRQYVKDVHHAEDLMLSGFLKVFTHLSKFKNEGSFEGWIRRIMVNTCISYLRKKNPVHLSDEDFVFNDQATQSLESTEVEDIQRLIDRLPVGYKMVFNLYAIEGYKHAEIAIQLQITESTSKS
jgi:RNA polymerase sigma-70 factor, ECF subfamily